MIEIQEKYIQQLRDAGLYVSKPFPAGHMWEHGMRVAKPTTTAGNSIPDFQFNCAGIPIDAPAVVLHPVGENWVVRAQEHAPVPGPGDFANSWKTAQEAIDDILDFYLGNPARMEKMK